MWNRFGRVKIYKKFTKVSLEWFIPFFWCWNRTSKYLPRHLNAIHLCGPFFGGQKKMSVYSKDLRPSALKWVFGHVFFRGEDFILQRVFCEGKTQTKQGFPETSLRGPYFGHNIFWRLQANSSFYSIWWHEEKKYRGEYMDCSHTGHWNAFKRKKSQPQRHWNAFVWPPSSLESTEMT